MCADSRSADSGIFAGKPLSMALQPLFTSEKAFIDTIGRRRRRIVLLIVDTNKLLREEKNIYVISDRRICSFYSRLVNEFTVSEDARSLSQVEFPLRFGCELRARR